MNTVVPGKALHFTKKKRSGLRIQLPFSDKSTVEHSADNEILCNLVSRTI